MTDDFEIVLCCLVVVCFAVMFYLAGKADFLTLVPKIFADRLEEINRKHGYWIADKCSVDVSYICSECKSIYCYADPEEKCDYNYCPNCGAKMDKKEGAEEWK